VEPEAADFSQQSIPIGLQRERLIGLEQQEVQVLGVSIQSMQDPKRGTAIECSMLEELGTPESEQSHILIEIIVCP
jgi:hypothetical protein